MIERVNRKIRMILEKVLEQHLLGVEKPVSVNVLVDDLIYNNGGIPQREVESIFEHLKEKGLVIEWFLGDESYDLIFADDFRDKARIYFQTLGQTESPERVDVEKVKIQLVEEKTGFYVVSKGNRIRLSDDVQSRKSKLTKFLSFPSFGTFRTIESVADAIKLPKDQYDQYTNKEALIRNTVKEIQRTLVAEKSSVRFKLKIQKGSIAMLIDDRKSG